MQTDTAFSDAVALYRQGRINDARVLFLRLLQSQPDHFGANLWLGVAALQSKDPRLAMGFLEAAVRLKPGSADAHHFIGTAFFELQDHHRAIESYDESLKLKADNAEALYNRGNVKLDLGRLADALDDFDRALALRPDHAPAHNNRGIVLANLRRLEEAIESFNKILALDPGNAVALHNRGNTFQDLGQFQAAIESYDRAVAINPDYAEAHNNRGNALAQLKRFEAAIDSYQRARSLGHPINYLPGQQWQMRMQICDWAGIETLGAEIVAGIETGAPVASPLAVLALSDSSSLQLKAAEIFVREEYSSVVSLGSFDGVNRSDKIRVGYFSGDFHQHPVALLLAEVIELHDRAKFEITAFSFGARSDDPMRERLVRGFDRFIDAGASADQDIAQLARSLKLDIAVDLAGFTHARIPAVLARRVAPIQVEYLGYLATLGASFVDYLISDATAIPAAARKHYGESVIYMPDCFLPNDSHRAISRRGFGREEFGLPPGGFVYCCFNTSYKITPAVFATWMRILKRVPNSVLWLAWEDQTTEANLRRSAAAHGVDSLRLVFARRMAELPDHLERIQLADLFLDTRPYNAHATAVDALWCGVPVLTHPGESFGSRVAASLLTTIKMPELIAANEQEYEAIAVAAAVDPGRMGYFRDSLAKNRSTAPLFDTRRYTRHLEAGFRQIHERRLCNQPPADVFVERGS